MIFLPVLQTISPPDPWGLLTAVTFMVAGVGSVVAGILGRVVQKRPYPVPVLIALVGIADLAYAWKYAQLILPGFPGNPIPSAEIRPFMFLISLVALSVPIGFWWTGDRELRLMQRTNERVEQERNLAQFMEAQLKQQLASIQEDKAVQQRMFGELKQLIITNVSHELQTPLAISLGYIDMIFSGTFGDVSNSPLNAPLTTVHSSARRMSAVVERMVNSVREPVYQLADMALIVRQTLDDPDIWLNTRRNPADVAIRADIGDGLDVVGDVKMLRLAVFELLNNALKFKATTVTVSAFEQAGEVVVRVADDGIGISRRFHKLIFEAMFQVRMDSKRPFEGAGMGLAVVERIARVHDGFVQVESRLGQGAIFTFTMPAQQSDVVVTQE
jgi:signal transduction histidine kinase